MPNLHKILIALVTLILIVTVINLAITLSDEKEEPLSTESSMMEDVSMEDNEVKIPEIQDKVSPLYLVEYEGDFTEVEKVLVQNLVLDPWMIFQSGNDREYDKVVVSKVGTNLPVFHITAYLDGKVATAFGLSSIKGQYDYERWTHTCFLLDCEGEIPEEFAEQYPELVIRAKALGLRTEAAQ